MDKQVVMCDFKGIKAGSLVNIDKEWRDGASGVGLVLERVTYAHMLGEGDNESYDPMLVVLTDVGRRVVPVGVVKIINENNDDR